MNIYCVLLKYINIPLRATKLPNFFREFFVFGKIPIGSIQTYLKKQTNRPQEQGQAFFAIGNAKH